MFAVTSFADVWIEIGTFGLFGERQWVTSFAEVWIEMPI